MACAGGKAALPIGGRKRLWFAPVLRFGITGGIGSGKSEVGSHLRNQGVPVLDADELARQVVAPGSDGLAEVVGHFGSAVVRGGRLDRAALASRVFGDPGALETLNRILHPRIRSLYRQRSAELQQRGEPLLGYEVPLLYETGLERELCPVVVVWVPPGLQRTRALARGGLTDKQFEARLSAQSPLDDKARRAQFVIDNSGPRSRTGQHADRFLGALRARLREGGDC